MRRTRTTIKKGTSYRFSLSFPNSPQNTIANFVYKNCEIKACTLLRCKLLVMFEWRPVSRSSVFDKYMEGFFCPLLMGENIKWTLLWKREFWKIFRTQEKGKKKTINCICPARWYDTLLFILKQQIWLFWTDPDTQFTLISFFTESFPGYGYCFTVMQLHLKVSHLWVKGPMITEYCFLYKARLITMFQLGWGLLDKCWEWRKVLIPACVLLFT